MAVKIRLMRIGAKKRPFYRVVAVDEHKKRTGAYLELLGTYNPLTEPKEIKLNQDRIDDWVKKGAQLSDGFLRITGKAPQRPPRKPKKEKKSAPLAPAEQVATPTEPVAETGAAKEASTAETENTTEAVESTETTDSTDNSTEPTESTQTPNVSDSSEPADSSKVEESK